MLFLVCISLIKFRTIIWIGPSHLISKHFFESLLFGHEDILVVCCNWHFFNSYENAVHVILGQISIYLHF